MVDANNEPSNVRLEAPEKEQDNGEQDNCSNSNTSNQASGNTRAGARVIRIKRLEPSRVTDAESVDIIVVSVESLAYFWN